MNLKRALLAAHELIFQATIRGNSNWIRFPKNSEFHVMVGRGEIPGVSLENVTILGNLCEIRV